VQVDCAFDQTSETRLALRMPKTKVEGEWSCEGRSSLFPCFFFSSFISAGPFLLHA
jgi:hypothetical protein